MERESFEVGGQEAISIEDIRKKAKTMLSKYPDEYKLGDIGIKEDFPDRHFYDKSIAVDHFLKNIPPEVLVRFWGHGITKGSKEDQLTAVMAIAEKSLIKGWAGNFTRSQPPVYTSGPALVISKIDGSLMKRDKNGEPLLHKLKGLNQLDYTADAWEADIGAIILNSEFYPFADELKKMYPDVKIFKANEMSDLFKE
jgi:hypothetical protein